MTHDPPATPATPSGGGTAPDMEGGVERRVVELAGGRASYLAAGAGPPVVLVHGLGLSADVWRPHLADLAVRGYAALAPDLPGYGASETRDGDRGVDGTATWLTDFARTLGLGAPAWIGHSLSVQALVRLGAASPRRVATLVLAAPTGRPGPRPVRLLRQMAGLARTAPRERPALLLLAVRQYLGAPLTTLTTWVRASGHDPLEDAPAVAAPALVVVGSRDPVAPTAFGERLVGALPRGALKRIEGAAHAVALDPYPPFMEAVTGFLEAVYRPRPTSDRWKSAGIASKSHGSVDP